MRPVPYTFEDRTGLHTASDFDDIYERLFLRVARPAPQDTTTVLYNAGRRASRHRAPFQAQPEVLAVLEFTPLEGLGSVTLKAGSTTASNPGGTTVPMAKWLRRVSMFGGSLYRKFAGSDGREYRWSFRSVEGQEWTCTCTAGTETYVVAHYDVAPPDVRTYGSSGNTFTVYEPFAHVLVELLASLTIMRHIAAHNL